MFYCLRTDLKKQGQSILPGLGASFDGIMEGYKVETKPLRPSKPALRCPSNSSWGGYEGVSVEVAKGTSDAIVVLLSNRSLHDEDHTAVHTILYKVVVDG